MQQKKLLLSFKTFSSHGLDRLKEALLKIDGLFTVKRVSSVFRVNRKAESFMSIAMEDGEEKIEGYVAVLECSYDGPLMELGRRINDFESGMTDKVTRRVLSINVLAVDDVILKTPGLTLPHPEFHLRPEELIPACELWPSYEHPILKRPIRDIAKELPNHTWGEFHCQGQALLDNN